MVGLFLEMCPVTRPPSILKVPQKNMVPLRVLKGLGSKIFRRGVCGAKVFCFRTRGFEASCCKICDKREHGMMVAMVVEMVMIVTTVRMMKKNMVMTWIGMLMRATECRHSAKH